MKKILVMLIFVILFGACVKRSELTVYNDTGHTVRVVLGSSIYQLLANDPPAVEIYYLNSFILYGETLNVPLIIYGQIYLKQKEFNIEMKPNKDKTYHVEFDRAGLQINNASLFPIKIVQLKKEDEEDWSENVINDTLYTETLSSIFSIVPDYDFIKITDIFDTEYPEELIELNVGETTTYTFTGL